MILLETTLNTEFWVSIIERLLGGLIPLAMFWLKINHSGKKTVKAVESSNKVIKTMMELIVFGKGFVRKYKRESRKFIDKQSVNENVKSFLKGGVVELSKIFLSIIESQFKITDAEIEDDIKESKVTLSSKFKAKCNKSAECRHIIESEMLVFLEYYQNIKILENGDRMSKFETLCKKTTIHIVTKISEL